MKIPKQGSVAEKICKALMKIGPMKYSQICDAMFIAGHTEKTTAGALHNMRADMQLFHENGRYSITQSMRLFYEMSAPTIPYAGQIVPPRTAREFRPYTPAPHPR